MAKFKKLKVPDHALLVSTKEQAQDKPMYDAGGGYREGDIVRLSAYVHLVALEAKKSESTGLDEDGDYHIQVTGSYKNGTDNIIVEVPFRDFVSDAALRSKLGPLRKNLRTNLGKNKEFSKKGNCMEHPPRMAITGQLFIDSHHAISNPDDPSGGRGKRKQPAATVWEIHPVFAMDFLDKKDPSKPVVVCPD